MRRLGSKVDPAPAPSADFSQSENKGLQMGQNYGNLEASFYSDSILGVNIAAGASVYMGEKKTVEDKLLDVLIAGDGKDRCDIGRPEPGTCGWVFEHEAFRGWVSSGTATHPPLYIQGTAGSGKSVLLKFLAKELEKRMRVRTPSTSSPVEEALPLELGVPGKTIAAICFCDDKNEMRRKPIWILRTLLYKTVQQNRDLAKYALKHLQSAEDLDSPGADPDEFHSVDVLQKILQDIVSDSELEVLYFIIDGLDQCGPHLPAVVRLISDISTSVNKEAASRGAKFRLRCIISDRGSKIVRDKLLPQHIIDMPKDNRHDIDKVTEKKIKDIQDYREFSDDVLKSTIDLLKESCKGMFKWLSLVLEDLSTWDGAWTEIKVKERLHNIPSDVATYYKTMLERQQRDSVSTLRTLLTWMYFACRPLTLQELNAALTLQEKTYTCGVSTDEEIDALQRRIENSWGALFLVHDGTVHLSHQSVKDFLSDVFSDEGAKEYEGYGMSRSDAHRQMAATCLRYLQISDVYKREVPKPPVNNNGMIDETQLITVKEKYLEGFPFLQYTVEFLGHHLRESRIQEETDVPGMKEFFSADSAALLSWVRSYDLLKRWASGKYSGFSSSTSLLFVAARLNLPWLANRATTWRSIGSLPVDVRTPDMSGWSAIHLAADSGAAEMVAWLLENNAYVDAETMGYSHPGRTALHFAASKRSDAGPQMVQKLLEGGAKATAQTRQGGNTPLHYAVDGRSVATVQALLASGADANATNGSGITPLHKAVAIPGLEELVEAMLKGGADPNKKTSIGTVSAARALVSLKVSRNMWQNRYDANVSQSALHIAAKAKDAERTVEVLLQRGGADPNCRDGAGRTALHVAVVRPDAEAITKLLIDSRIDVNAQDMDGKTPLLVFLTAAALEAKTQPPLPLEIDDQAYRERVLDILLSAGADPSIEAKDKSSSISYAKEAQLQWAIDKLEQRLRETGNHTNIPKQEPEPVNGEKGVKKGFLDAQASRWIPKRSWS
ncbi:skeletrophin, putative [Talaromyces stipitatus ATCC 10500]|uniref:Skeletrophin, putative n=1 Tax=Talaromyces stipitatus (strain ATCC 10500 / CBS 375.48 / QM 6759 / NRRL 1006) TaxID=441959 RepID=B8MGG2_TALSN|nr:skeletrophin, putative [Talaromyces stipitatus ATCC 10500]EED16283.1 skeletrophin, putative [Talaromyces stipitatus ATCC 10500]